MNEPLFSICIPTYNSGTIIQKTIDSCLKQQFKDYELLIVDDHSTDHTVDILNTYKHLPFVAIHINEQNIGMTANWNKCLKLAKGKYIAFVHHDDEITPDYLQDASRIIAEHSNLGILAFENQRQTSSPFYGRVDYRAYFNCIFEWKYVIPPSQAIFINLKDLGYNPDLNYSPEAELYLYILKAEYDVFFSDQKHCIRNFGNWGMNISTKYYYHWRTFKDRIELTKKWQHDPWLSKETIYRGLKATAIHIYERRARGIALGIKDYADPLISYYLKALNENQWFGIMPLQQLKIKMIAALFFIKKFATSVLYRLTSKNKS